jgi:ribonucleoside-diphosphate reductase subunit M2
MVAPSKRTAVDEPILRATKRISAIPLDPTYKKIWKNYKLQKKSIWFVEKIKLDVDIEYFPQLPQDIQDSTLLVLGFFAGSDEIVGDNIQKYFLNDITIPEIKYAYSCQVFVENIHSEMYNTLIVRLVGTTKREKILRAIENFPSVKQKAEWALKWSSSDTPYAWRCIAFACVEGIFFSSSFAFIDWLKTQDYKLPALYESNSYISKDEARHTECACLIYEHIRDRPSHDKVKEIIDEAIAIECMFVREMLPQGYRGMNEMLMVEHVQHCAAMLANDLGYSNLYRNTRCPFPFMIKRSLDTKDNFFEIDGTEYNLPDVGDEQKQGGFSLDADFED